MLWRAIHQKNITVGTEHSKELKKAKWQTEITRSEYRQDRGQRKRRNNKVSTHNTTMKK